VRHVALIKVTPTISQGEMALKAAPNHGTHGLHGKREDPWVDWSSHQKRTGSLGASSSLERSVRGQNSRANGRPNRRQPLLFRVFRVFRCL